MTQCQPWAVPITTGQPGDKESVDPYSHAFIARTKSNFLCEG